MAKFAQTKRMLTVSSSLGDDVLLLAAFAGKEEMSRLFHYSLDLLSENDAIAPADVVGKPLTWAVHNVHSDVRYFNGYVNRFAAGGKAAGGLRSYRAEVVPWLWFLTRTANCKIFQNKSADKIIQAIFDDLGFSDYKFSLNRTPVTRDYCVQYRETAFNFVSRLMEQEGIFYFFKHEDGKHTLTLVDAKSAYADCPEDEVEYAAGTLPQNHISAWEHQYEYRPGKWTQTDYNFETPSTSLLTTTSTVVDLPNISSYEQFDYPGLYAKTADGTPLTKVRMEEEEAPYDVVAGASNCCTFTPGGKFKLTRHECDAEKKTYALTGVQHTATDPSYQMTGGGGDYANTFTCIPASVVFRPARSTPKPFVQGPQTALVVGPSGEEIYTDKYGRIKVQFYWDRDGKKDENSSCFIRVAELWAGKTWGIVFNPRIGQEVVVDFLEGDPDRPLITGRVYNAEQMPPYELPTNQTQSVIKSRSSKGGGTDNFNELRIEDKKGSEEIYFHAEKDFNRVVENNDTLKVGSNKADDGSQTIEIWKDRTETVKTGNETITVEKGNRTVTVSKGDDLHQVKTGNRTVKVDTGDDLHQVKTGNRTIKVDTGNDLLQVKTGNRDVKVDTGNDTLTVTTGNHKIAVSAGKSEITAAQSITLSVTPASVKLEPSAITLSIGPSSIKLEPAAITLSIGPNTVKLDMAKILLDGLMLSANGQLQTEVKGGLMASFGGAIMNKLGGGAMVMIG